ncbi:hypothetical protein [Pontiella sulfatireligans]|uniref:Uncharacterized protein n=1 Tax=Pontiella sulfatireligans TaxID=2750658 RepID=A0A6C2UGB5_9BACT|nr:hypothetical protein [Pontiella sulfatireligans]VGO19220.1 hypothetical protein SCARR_01277 [Pontiella sulfatireligans]
MKKFIGITMALMTAAISASAQTSVVNDITFNETAGTTLDGVSDGAGGTGTFSPNSVMEAYGATDGSSLVWSNMAPANTSAYAALGSTFYAGTSNTILRSTVRFNDFNFDAETTYNSGIGVGIGDGSKMAFLYLKVGGPGNQVQMKADTVYGDDLQTTIEISSDTNLNMTALGWTGIQLRMDIDLETDTYSTYYLREGVDTIWQLGAVDGAFGLTNTNQTNFVELDKIRIGMMYKDFEPECTVEIDQWTIETFQPGPPAPPPEVELLESWDLTGGVDGAAVGTVPSSTGTGSTLGGAVAKGVDIQGETVNLFAAGTGAAFKGFTHASYAGATTGVYQVSFDMTTWDMVNTAASNTSAQAGFGFRFNDGSDHDLSTLARYSGATDQFVLTVTGTGGNTTVVLEDGTVASDVINVRQVLDMDLGTYSVFYTIGAGAEQTAAVEGVYAGQTIGEFRQQFQTINGGNYLQAGDTMQMDNITLAKLNPATGDQTPEEAYESWLADYTVGADTNLTDDADGDLLDNLSEYAFGGAPDNPADQGNTPVESQMSEGGTNYLEYVYFERDDAADRGLSSILNVGTDLVNTNWTTTGIEFVGSGASAVSGYNAVTNRVETDVDVKFLCLNITFTP